VRLEVRISLNPSLDRSEVIGMLSGGPLGIVSVFLTYFVQISLAYLAVLLACALIRTPRICLRAWAAVLVFTVVR
jgi:hypothetical protein